MKKARLEAFSDGVIAIIITIMVLELKPPHEPSWHGIRELVPVFISYIVSFAIVGIYWGNHHHLLLTIEHVNSSIIWANLHFLFWLSLIPFTTAWMGENNFHQNTVAAYAILLDLTGVAYFILLKVIRKAYPGNEALLIALQKQSGKGLMSCIIYTLAVATAFINPAISACLFVLVAVLWMVPDRNIERSLKT